MKGYCGKRHKEESIVPEIIDDDLKALDDAYRDKVSQLDSHKNMNSGEIENTKNGSKMSRLEAIGEYLMRCLSR